MSNIRQISSLADLAFEALLRHRAELTPNTELESEVLIQYKLKKESPLFLQSIADGDPDSAKEFLEENPLLAVFARGTVTTASGNTYENVTAIELTYVLDDVDMCNSVLLPAIQKLPEDMIKKADEQLAKKMAEVDEQRSEFELYDFSALTEAITADETLKATGKASAVTEEAFAKFKEYFKPGVIKFGKSFIKVHLYDGYVVYDENSDEQRGAWNGKQSLWYLTNIIGTLQCRAEKCFEQACSQGLKEIVFEKKPLERSDKLEYLSLLHHIGVYEIEDVGLTFRGSADGQLLLSRDYYVDIYDGQRGFSLVEYRTPSVGLQAVSLEKYVEQIDQGMDEFKLQLEDLVCPIMLDQLEV